MKKPASKVARAATGAASGAVKRRAAPRAGDRDATPTDATSAEAVPPRGAKQLLTAGIKALTSAHEEAVARQSRVFESLLGVRRDDAPDARPVAAPALDPFGFRKFEDVFDQRVASALAHLGVPSAEAFAALEAEVKSLRTQLDEAVAALKATRPRR